MKELKHIGTIYAEIKLNALKDVKESDELSEFKAIMKKIFNDFDNYKTDKQ